MNMTGHACAQSVAPHYGSEQEPEHDGMYYHILSHASLLPPPDHDRVNADANEDHFAIATSSASRPDNRPFSINMTCTSKELAH